MNRHVFAAVLSVIVTGACATAAEHDYPVRPIPLNQVRLHEGFWGPRLTTNREVTVWYDFHQCEVTGRIDNFAKAGGLMPGTFRGIFFDDSDVFKVIEGASYTLALRPDAKLDQYLDDLIAKIAAAQEEDGYLYTYRTLKAGDAAGPRRWSVLGASHELYNVGHMYEAAVAHYLATGKRTLLNVAIKNAELIDQTFGPAATQRKDPPGHQEIEIGLAKLYRATGDTRWIKLAKFFLEVRGKSLDGRKLYGLYAQDHSPVLKQRQAVGHAVRAAYMYTGMADVAALEGDSQYAAAIDEIWKNVVSRKLYLTGGIGARHEGEAFGDDYELPNREAYNETCAAIANCLWNHRMFLLHGDGKYMDVFERTLYNGFLAGIGLSGNTFFYSNPLAADGKWGFNQGNCGRSPWFGCSCCPVNVVRFFPSIGGCMYAQDENAVYVNLFATSDAQFRMGERQITLEQRTDYPWDGQVNIHLKVDQPTKMSIRIRIPGWAQGVPVPSDLYHYADSTVPAWKIAVNEVPLDTKVEKGFICIEREWKSGDQIALALPMPVRRVLANEKVAADRGRVAIERGPVVYCVEGIDHEGYVADLVLDDAAVLTPSEWPDQLGRVIVLRGTAKRVVGSGTDHQPANGTDVIAQEPAPITAIPYYAWAHRGVGPMAVWLARDAKVATPRAADQK